MALQKNFPKARQYFFWAIVANYMAANTPTASDMDRRVFGGLAYKLLSKAAFDVPADIVSFEHVCKCRPWIESTC